MNETVIDNLVIEISADSRAASANIDAVAASLKKLNSASSNTNKTASSLSKLSRAIKALGVGQFLRNAVKDVNSYVENINLFTVSMGEFASEAMAYAERVQSALGVDMSEFIRNQAIFKNMADGFGLAEEKAYQLSKGMTELAYDISSFYNVGTEEVFQRLQSGIAGEIEPVRRWGIALDQASMKQWLLKEGIDANVSSLTQADKALVRYNMMVEAMRDNGAIGDLARTLETPANAIRILNQQITQLSRAIGTLLIPVISKVIPYIQAFVKAVTNAAQALANLFGIDIDFNVDFGGVTSGISGVGDAMDDATASAKKLKDYTMGFDELNIINPNAGAGAQQVGGAGLDLEAMSVWDEAIFANINSQVDELTGKIQKLLPLIAAVGAAFLYWRIGNTVMAVLKDVYKAVSAIWGILMGNAMVATSGQSGLFKALTFISKYKGPLAIVAVAITAVTLALVDLWKNSETFRARVRGVIAEIQTAWLEFKDTIWNSVITPIMDAFGITADNISQLYSEHIRPIVEKIALVFIEILGGAIVATIDLFTGLAEIVGGIMGNIAEFISNFVTAGVENITSMRDQFSDLWDQIKKNSATKWGIIKDTIVNLIDSARQKVENIAGKISSTVIGMAQTVINWINSALSALEGFLNKVTGGALNINLPEVSLGTKTETTEVKKYATGGILEDGLFTMNHGEIAGKFNNGQSVVANNQQIIEGIADGVYRAMMAAQSDENSKPVEVSVYLDGKQISKSVDKYNNSRGRVIMGNGLGYNF